MSMLTALFALSAFWGADPAPSTANASPTKSRPNVLFIAVDDLRPTLGCYGDTKIKTPNIDRLANSGATFLRAYCQQAVCSPSRTSLMLGLRPDTTGVYDLQRHFRDNIPNVVTLPQAFANNGYNTSSLGKIYHGGLDDVQSWNYKSAPLHKKGDKSKKQVKAKQVSQKKSQKKKDANSDAPQASPAVTQKTEQAPKGLSIAKKKDRGPRGPAWNAPDAADEDLGDGRIAAAAIETLQSLQKEDKPFFLAVGFYKPHLPFVAPKKYFDLYSPSDFDLPTNYAPPQNVPDPAMHTFGELRAYEGIPAEGPLTDKQARELLLAYHAAASYADAQIGKVLDELDRLGLAENTVVVLWGDHGWHLGDQGLWCKHTNFEVATHAPLLLRAPGVSKPGEKINALVEFVDIYPTLCQLCSVPTDAPTETPLEGTSMVPLLKDPNTPWSDAAFSQYPRGKFMGYTIRTDRYRYTEWAKRQNPKDGETYRELYDEKSDPLETVNIADDPKMASVVEDLHQRLAAGWKGALPKSTKESSP